MTQVLTKVCTKCKIEKPLSDFYKRSNRRSGVHSQCRECEKINVSAWNNSLRGSQWRKEYRQKNLARMREYERKRDKEHRKNNPLWWENYELKRKLGITLEEKNAKFESQGKRCAVCHSPVPNVKNKWFADHDHKTKKFRGVLCGHCNSCLGYASDNPAILFQAAMYLLEHAA